MAKTMYILCISSNLLIDLDLPPPLTHPIAGPSVPHRPASCFRVSQTVAMVVVKGMGGLWLAAWAVAAMVTTIILASKLRLVGAGGFAALLGVFNVTAASSHRLCWALALVVDMLAEFILILLATNPLAVSPSSEPGAVTHTLTCGLVQV